MSYLYDCHASTRDYRHQMTKQPTDRKRKNGVQPKATAKSGSPEDQKHSVDDSPMAKFAWSNADVQEKLIQLNQKEIKLKEMINYLRSAYNHQPDPTTIRRQAKKLPGIPIAIPEDDILRLNTMQGNQMVAVRTDQRFRLYRLHSDQAHDYACIDCKNIGAECPMLTLKNGEFYKNTIQHHDNCRLYNRNELLSRNIDRKKRIEIRSNTQNQPMATWKSGLTEALKVTAMQGEDSKDPDSVACLYPSWEQVRHQYDRARREGNLTVKDPFNLPEVYKSTYRDHITKSAERWQLCSDKATGVIIFSSDDDLKTAAKCSLLVADATFEVRAKGTAQLYTVHGLYPTSSGSSEWVIVALAIMFNRLQSAYEKIFAELKAAWKSLELQPVFTHIHIDYELAEMGAAVKIFGISRVRGCLFHFSQAMLKQVKEYGLFRAYKKEAPVRKILRKLLALPLLPKESARIIWDRFLMPKLLQAHPSAPEFCKYFNKQWMSIRGELWSFHRLENRTTNSAEGYHSFLKRRHGALKWPGFTSLLPFLQELQYEQSHRVLKLDAGAASRRPNKKYVKLNLKLTELWDQLDEKSKHLALEDEICQVQLRFLHKASKLLSDVDVTGNRTKKAGKIVLNKRRSYSKKYQSKSRRSKKLSQTRRASSQSFATSSKAFRKRKSSTFTSNNNTSTTPNLDTTVAKRARKISKPSPTHLLLPTTTSPSQPTSFFAIDGDGNCFYRSVALLVYGKSCKHEQVRRELMYYLKGAMERGEKWTGIFGSVEQGIKLVREQLTPKTWGEANFLFAAAKRYGMNFALYMPSAQDKFLLFSSQFEGSFVAQSFDLSQKMGMIRYNGFHFDVCLWEDENTDDDG